MANKTTIKGGRLNDRPAMKREVIKADSFVSIYANDIQVEITPWDMRLTVGVLETLPSSNNSVMTVKALAELHISPQLAKILSSILTNQVNTYEKQFGEIPVPREQ